jgi:hypothetical protein
MKVRGAAAGTAGGPPRAATARTARSPLLAARLVALRTKERDV